MLHLINKSPFTSTSLDSCIKYAEKGAAILLFEDGVYGAMAGTSLGEKMAGITGDYDVYALKEDLRMRGIDKVTDGIKEVDYPGFVDLVEQHKTASWS